MIEQEVLTNQTQFSIEEPIFEDGLVIEQAPKKKPKSRKKLLIIVGVIGFFFLLLILLLVLASKKEVRVSKTETSNEVVKKQELGPLEKRIKDARELLEQADPSKDELAFPPVNMNLRLEDRE